MLHNTKPVFLQLYLFVQKATITGLRTTRIEVVVSSMEDNETIIVKFWNDKILPKQGGTTAERNGYTG